MSSFKHPKERKKNSHPKKPSESKNKRETPAKAPTSFFNTTTTTTTTITSTSTQQSFSSTAATSQQVSSTTSSVFRGPLPVSSRTPYYNIEEKMDGLTIEEFDTQTLTKPIWIQYLEKNNLELFLEWLKEQNPADKMPIYINKTNSMGPFDAFVKTSKSGAELAVWRQNGKLVMNIIDELVKRYSAELGNEHILEKLTDLCEDKEDIPNSIKEDLQEYLEENLMTEGLAP